MGLKSEDADLIFQIYYQRKLGAQNESLQVWDLSLSKKIVKVPKGKLFVK